MATSALRPVSDAIFARLNVPSLKTGLGITVAIKDFVPQPAPFPFVLYSMAERDISGLGTERAVKSMPLRLHVFSQAQNMGEAQRIMAVAVGLLQFAAPTATGWLIPAIGRPNDVIPVENSEINGVVCRELVSIWDHVYADEVPS